MELELVTVGTELLLGLTLDTNAADLARTLAPVGVRVARRTTVADEIGAVRDAVGAALGRTRFVIVTGGLGPTSDDVTKRAVAELFDAPLELDAAYLAELERRFADLGRGPLPPSNRGQAEVPRGAAMLPNPQGTAPGLWLEGARGIAVLLPGVPHEMRALLEAELVPRLQRRLAPDAQRGGIVWRVLRTTGVAESALAARLEGVERELAPVTLAYLPSALGVDLRLTAWNLAPADAPHLLESAARRVRDTLGQDYYGDGDTDLAAVVLDELRHRGWRLAAAESCSGGLLGARLTAIPGASEVFVGGVVCYADESKVRDLAVPRDLLVQHGAVSEPVVRALATGVARRFGAEAAIAITGIAGPSGGSPEKPVGTVWLSARAGDAARTVRRRFLGDREEIRQRSAQAALDLLRRILVAET